jgi:hypothetical protein
VRRGGTDGFDLAQEHMADACECGKEHSGFIKSGGFLDKFRTC